MATKTKTKTLSRQFMKILEDLNKDLAKNGDKGEAAEVLRNIPGIKLNGRVFSNGSYAGGGVNPVTAFMPSAASRAINDFALPLVGDVASGIGNSFNAYNSLLANALIAASKPTGYRSGAVDNIFAAPAAMMAGGLGARGAIAKTIGDTVANRMYQVSNNNKQIDANARYMQFMQAHADPTSNYIPGNAYSRMNVNPFSKGNSGVGLGGKR